MPLNTQVIRDGQALKIAWGQFHVACMVIAASVDSGQGPFYINTREAIMGSEDRNAVMVVGSQDVFKLVSYPVIGTTPMNSGEYVLRGKYIFQDAMDGEVFELLPGDVLQAFRN